MIYCSTCRVSHFSVSESEPPYASIHRLTDPVTHVHPITGEVLEVEA